MQLLSFFKLEVLLVTCVIGLFYGAANGQIPRFAQSNEASDQELLANTTPQCPRINVAQAPL